MIQIILKSKSLMTKLKLTIYWPTSNINKFVRNLFSVLTKLGKIQSILLQV